MEDLRARLLTVLGELEDQRGTSPEAFSTLQRAVQAGLQRDPGREFPEWHPWAGTLGPDGLGSPSVFVSDRCKNLIAEIPDYRWQDLSPTAERDKDQPEAPRKKDDHAVDAFRYGIMARPRPKRTTVSDEQALRRFQTERLRPADTVGLLDRRF